MKPGMEMTVVAHVLLMSHIQMALSQLKSSRNISDETVHDVRKQLKRARAILRLLRPNLGTRTYQREKRTLQHSARQLARLRDIKALLGTMQQLLRKLRYQPAAIAKTPLYMQLKIERTLERRGLRGLPQRKLIRELQLSERRLGNWATFKLDRRLIIQGLVHTHKQGRRALAKVKRNLSDDKLHELRKRAKCLGYQLDVLNTLKLVKFRNVRVEARKLGALLGDDHDLATLQRRYQVFLTNTDIVEVIGHRRAKLQEKALRTADRLYAIKSRALFK